MPTDSSPDLTHSCSEIINLTSSSRTDSSDQPSEQADEERFTDGSRFAGNGQLKVGSYKWSVYKTVLRHNPFHPQPRPKRLKL